MAIIADIVHHGAVYRDIYISPHSINSDSFYTLKYLVGGKNGPPLLGMEETMRSFTFNNSRAGLSKPDGAGVVYDRSVGAWPQVYADLRAKIAAGACPWITNVRDESEVLAAEVPVAVEALGDDLEKARAANRQLLTGDERATLPSEIAAMMDPGDTFSPEVRRKLTERLNVELAELKNLRGLAGEDLKREAKIENLLGLFARLGEI
mgnify:FL=1